MKKRCELTSIEMVAIVKSVKQDKLTHKEAGIKHWVNKSLVQSLVKESKNDSEFPKKTRQREQKQTLKMRAVVKQSMKHLQSKSGLMNAQQVSDSVLNDHNIRVSNQYVCSILRSDIGARYKPNKKVPYLGNSVR